MSVLSKALARRVFLGRAAAVMAAAPSVSGAAAAAIVGAAGQFSHGPYHDNHGGAQLVTATSSTRSAWERLGIPRKVWALLEADYQDKRRRLEIYRTAILGVVDNDIAALRSLSGAARARMQVDRQMARDAFLDRQSNLIWPPTPDDDE